MTQPSDDTRRAPTKPVGSIPPDPIGTDPRVRTLKWISATAACFVLAAGIAHGISRERSENAFEPRLAFPGFETTMGDVARVEIHTKETRFTLVKQDAEHWGVEERGNYPVRNEELRALLWGLGDLELVEMKTARAERHASIGLVPPEEGGEAVRITVQNGDAVTLMAALFGNPEGGDTLDGEVRTWMRMDGDNQTWLGEGRLEVEGQLEEWMDLDFLTVDAGRIASVHTTPGDVSQGSDAFTIARPDQDSYNFELLDLYDGEVMSGDTAANGLGRALIAMTFSDALPAASIGFDNAAIARYETFDGLALTLRTRRFEDNYWITLSAETFAVPEAVPDSGEDVASESEAAPDSEVADVSDSLDVSGEAADINARAAGWAFRIPEWKGGQLTVARASMIKPVPNEINDNE